MQRYGFFVKPPNVSTSFFKKSLFLLHFRVFCWEETPTDVTDSHRWCVFGILWILRSVGIQFSHGLHWSTQMVGCVSGCVGTAGCHTLLHLCKSVLSVGDSSACCNKRCCPMTIFVFLMFNTMSPAHNKIFGAKFLSFERFELTRLCTAGYAIFWRRVMKSGSQTSHSLLQ